MKTVKLAKASGCVDDADNDVRAAIEGAVAKLCSRQSAPMLRSGWQQARVTSVINDAILAATDAARIGEDIQEDDKLTTKRREPIRDNAKNALKYIRKLKQSLAHRRLNALPVGVTMACENTIISEQIAADGESNPQQRMDAQVHVQRLLMAEESLEWNQELFVDAEDSLTRRISQKSMPDRDTLINELALIWTAATGSKPPASKGADTPFYDFCEGILIAEGISKFDKSIASVCKRLDQYRLERALAGFYEPWGL
jgi:hypothetical protein